MLVDDRGDPSQVLIRTHFVSAPALDRPPLDLAATREARLDQGRARMQQARVTWHRWLDEEPLIQEFISDSNGKST